MGDLGGLGTGEPGRVTTGVTTEDTRTITTCIKTVPRVLEPTPTTFATAVTSTSVVAGADTDTGGSVSKDLLKFLYFQICST